MISNLIKNKKIKLNKNKKANTKTCQVKKAENQR